MSAGCRCGRGSGSARSNSLAAMPGSRDGTVRSTAAGSSFAGGRIAANGATIAPCAPSGRPRSGRPAPRSRGRTPARCVRRSGRFALPPLSNGRKAPNLRRGGCKSGNRSLGPRLLAASPRLARRSVRRCARSNRGSIDRAARRTGRKGAGGSGRSGRRPDGVRIRGRAARRCAATAVAMTEAEGTTVVVIGVAIGVAAVDGTTVVAAAEDAEASKVPLRRPAGAVSRGSSSPRKG